MRRPTSPDRAWHDNLLYREPELINMWNCPNCHRSQPFRRLIVGPGFIRKQWRCGNCNALLESAMIARIVICVLAGTSSAALLGWVVSVKLSPYGFVAFSVLAVLYGLYYNPVVVVEVDHIVCVRCRYDLHGNTSGACPECGTHIGGQERLSG